MKKTAFSISLFLILTVSLTNAYGLATEISNENGRVTLSSIGYAKVTVPVYLAAAKTAADVLAIKGYDTVAYFKSGKALKGSASITAQWHGMTWHFSTQANRELFEADPDKYAPQYDGYCAWAMTEARIAQTDPEVWKIVDGRLYLNCSQAAYDKWSKDIPGHIKKADANWLKLQLRN